MSEWGRLDGADPIADIRAFQERVRALQDPTDLLPELRRLMRATPTAQQAMRALGMDTPRSTPKVRPLKGRKGYWLREFSDTAELTLAKILDVLVHLGGGSCLCLKVADDLSWVGSYDNVTPVASIADLVAMRDACKAVGVTFLPVVVPRGTPGEAAFHAQIAEAVGALMVDIEPYAGATLFPVPITFWDKGPTTNIPQYWHDLRTAAPNAYLIAQPDPRQYGWSAAYVEECLPYYDALCCQHYVGWLAAGWTDVNAEVATVRRLLTLGKDVYVTIYGADPAFPLSNPLPSQFWQLVQPLVLGLCVFAFGAMNTKQLQTVANLPAPSVQPDPDNPPPDPPPPTPGPISDSRAQLGLWSASNAADLLDPDLLDTDVLPRVEQTAQQIVNTLQGVRRSWTS